MRLSRFYFVAIFCFLCCSALADEFLVSLGTGSQPGSNQHNDQFAVDYTFYSHDRSERSRISLGVGYTKLRSDTASNDEIDIISIYPQLTLTPVKLLSRNWYFFVRALGPSYISSNALGDRKQDNHFTFQAQAGFGYSKSLGQNTDLLIQVSWKHFSNANLFKDNDGIDVPLNLAIGLRF